MVRDQCTVEIHLEQLNFFELQRNEICISFTYSLYPHPHPFMHFQCEEISDHKLLLYGHISYLCQMDIFQLNQYSGASFIQILMIWMFHLLKTFEWDSIIKCYIKIHYLNALGTKSFLIAMPHCTYFVHNFKTFRRHFSHVRLFFLLED